MQDFTMLLDEVRQPMENDLFQRLIQVQEQPVPYLQNDNLRLPRPRLDLTFGSDEANGQGKRRYSCPTRNIYQNLKWHHFDFLKEKGVSLSHYPRITALLKTKNTKNMSQDDYKYLYRLPQCRQALEEMFLVNYLESKIRSSKCEPENKENQLNFVLKFRMAFYHPHQKFPSNRQIKSLSLKSWMGK